MGKPKTCLNYLSYCLTVICMDSLNLNVFVLFVNSNRNFRLSLYASMRLNNVTVSHEQAPDQKVVHLFLLHYILVLFNLVCWEPAAVSSCQLTVFK